jgi:hypothetical protein
LFNGNVVITNPGCNWVLGWDLKEISAEVGGSGTGLEIPGYKILRECGTV